MSGSLVNFMRSTSTMQGVESIPIISISKMVENNLLMENFNVMSGTKKVNGYSTFLKHLRAYTILIFRRFFDIKYSPGYDSSRHKHF